MLGFSELFNCDISLCCEVVEEMKESRGRSNSLFLYCDRLGDYSRCYGC